MPRKKSYETSKERAAPAVIAQQSAPRPRPSLDDAYIDMLALLGPEARFTEEKKVLNMRNWLGVGIDDWVQARAKAARDLSQLLRQTAESVDLRSTGHAWCISGTRGCHGQGVYDPSMCGGCSQAIIDRELAPAWQMIHLDNLRLAAITDCGPAVAEKTRRAVERSKQVLADLGVPLPSADQASEYNAELESA